MEGLVSVVIPTFGRAKLLPRALDSILSQTYGNIEVIVVDDNIDDVCSQETKKIVNRYKKENVIYIKNETNLGGALSRNVGINAARGEYLAFLDDDDYYLKDKIYKQVKYIENSLSDVVLCHMSTVDENDSVLGKKHIARCQGIGDFIIRGVAFTPMILMKTESARDAGMFMDTPRFQDHIFMLRILSSGKKVSIINEILAVHYEHSGERISNSDRMFKGYELRLNEESKIIPYLTRTEKSSAILKHATIKSKIITDTKSRYLGIIYLAKRIFFIRTVHDLKIFFRNMIRNIFFPKSYF